MHAAGKEVAQTVVLRGDEKALLAALLLPTTSILNKLSDLVRAPVGLLEETECNKLFPDCEPGSVPPFERSSAYLDEPLAEDHEIIFGAGTHSDAIRMGNVDFMEFVRPQQVHSPSGSGTSKRTQAACSCPGCSSPRNPIAP